MWAGCEVQVVFGFHLYFGVRQRMIRERSSDRSWRVLERMSISEFRTMYSIVYHPFDG